MKWGVRYEYPNKKLNKEFDKNLVGFCWVGMSNGIFCFLEFSVPQPFYLCKNKYGYFQVSFVNPCNNRRTSYKSTHTSNKAEATLVALDWMKNGIPSSKSNRIKFDSGLDIKKIASLLSQKEAALMIEMLQGKIEGAFVGDTSDVGSFVGGVAAGGVSMGVVTASGNSARDGSVAVATARGVSVGDGSLEGTSVRGISVRGASETRISVGGTSVGGVTVRGSSAKETSVEGVTASGNSVGGTSVKGIYIRGTSETRTSVGGISAGGSSAKGASMGGVVAGGASVDVASVRGSSVGVISVEGVAAGGISVGGVAASGASMERSSVGSVSEGDVALGGASMGGIAMGVHEKEGFEGKSMFFSRPKAKVRLVLKKKAKMISAWSPEMEEKKACEEREKTVCKVESTERVQAEKGIGFVQYLDDFWNEEKSDYIKRKRARGKGCGTRHCKEMRALVGRYLKKAFGTVRVQDVDEEMLEDFFFELRDMRKLSASTVNQNISCVKVALKWAFQKKIILSDPTCNIERYGLMGAEKRGIPTESEVKRLYERTWRNEASYLAFCLCASSGLRPGEISALRVCDVEENVLHIRHALDTEGRLKSTKNGCERDVPVSKELSKALLERARRSRMFGPLSFVFYNEKNNYNPYLPPYYADAFYEE